MKKEISQDVSYLSIDLLEKLGNLEPTQKQIDIIECLLTKVLVVKKLSFNQQLTKQEASCLYWAALGKTAAETAELMNIQPYTVQEYRKEIKKKLSCKTMAEAVFRGIQLGHIAAMTG
jgi:DNA-binding CsgD family transcriptional regulator